MSQFDGLTKEQFIEKMNQSYPPAPTDTFNRLVQAGVLFEVTLKTDRMHNDPMSANIVIPNWNHSEFLPMLFESFEAADRENIDLEFIITDSGSNDKNKKIIMDLLDKYRDTLKIRFLYHDFSEQRKAFEAANADGAFHGSVYGFNSALRYCKNDVFLNADSSNVVNKDWIRGMLSPHYIFHKSKLWVRSKGGDFTPEVGYDLKDAKFSSSILELPHTYVGFGGGNGMGFSLKTKNIKALKGFNQLLSCCAGPDDDLRFRCKEDGFQFLGHESALAIHRPHYSGWESKGRKSAYGYRKMIELFVEKTETTFDNKVVEPLEIHCNF